MLDLTTPQPGVLLMTLNRPQARNALSRELRQLLSAEFARADQDDEVRAVVITGNRDYFAAGADIKAMAEIGTADHVVDGLHPYWDNVKRFRKPLIAAVEGYALGGGCELAMHADIIIAARDAKFGQPEVRLGIMPGAGGTQRLLRAVGKYRAMYLTLTGTPITGEEAAAAGLASLAVEPGTAMEEALKVAASIAAMPPLAVRMIKEVLLAGADLSLESALTLERKAMQTLFSTEDQKEGVAAFIEKRKPQFRGR